MAIQHTTLPQSSPFARYFFPNFTEAPRLSERIHLGGVELPENLIYLDHAAATPIDTRVLMKMLPWMTHIYGNPANRLHPMGEFAEHGLAQARLTIAEALGVGFDEVIFCSSATEANNLLLRGLVQHPLRKRNKIVVAATEHSSILSTALELANQNIEIQYLHVDEQGQIDLSSAKSIIDDQTLCVCVMDVNNETGIVQKHLDELIAHSHSTGALVHVDAVQGFARGHFHGANHDFDSATISGAKIYGGRGAAALIIRKRTPRTRLSPMLTGGGHENGMRSGTPNLAAIVGFAEAVRLQMQERHERLHHLAHLESLFLSHLSGLADFKVAGDKAKRVPGLLMLHFPGVNAMKLIETMKYVCVSSGSACRTLQATASHVLKAMGADDDVALSSIRVSVGLTNTEQEMHIAAQIIAEKAKLLKATSANLPI